MLSDRLPGRPIDPVFQDRELFADYLTSYYTDIEPESCFVLEQNGRVVGYLLGSRRPYRQQIHSFFQNIRLLIHGISRYRAVDLRGISSAGSFVLRRGACGTTADRAFTVWPFPGCSIAEPARRDNDRPDYICVSIKRKPFNKRLFSNVAGAKS